jgi:predicted AlkP superfamily pyrophosphatase or phosphodiesterase
MPFFPFVSRAASLTFLFALAGISFALPGPVADGFQKSAPKKAEPQLAPISRHVILISISGLRADFVTQPDSFRLRMPRILSLRAKGGYAVGTEGVFPSQTIPAHATIVTGTTPADHGITSDYPFDIETGMEAETPYQSLAGNRGESIWETSRRAGLTTATAGFPLTIGAAINFNLHPLATNESTSDAELRLSLSTALRQKTVAREAAFKKDQILLPEDAFNADALSYLIEKYRPNVSMIHFASLEKAQAKFGLESQQAVTALDRIDGLISQIGASVRQAGLEPEVTWILLSDYGASKVEQEFRPNVVLKRKGLLSSGEGHKVVSWRAMAQTYGGSAAIYVRNPKDEKFVQEIEALFQEQHQRPDSPIWRVIPRRDAARLGADPRAILYLDASPAFTMSNKMTGSSVEGTAVRSAHGYSPSRSEMRGALILAGHGIKPGSRLEYARLIDIAPTIARLIGSEMKTARGRVLSEFLVEEKTAAPAR